jgi:hypothetical protein
MTSDEVDHTRHRYEANGERTELNLPRVTFKDGDAGVIALRLPG